MPLAVGRSAVHIDVPLSNFAVQAFAAGEEGLVGNMLVPEVPVGKQSDKFYIIEKDAFQRIENTRRAPRTAARRVQFSVSSESYFAENFALAAENALEDLENADVAIQLRENSTRLVVTNLLRDQENRIASKLTSISNVGSGVSLTGASKWNDPNSDPLGDVNTAHAFVRQQTGLIPNTLVIDWDTQMILRRHPQMLDLFKFTSGGELTDDQLRQVFKVGRVLVARGIKENLAEGATGSSITNIWQNVALFAHVGANTGLQSMVPMVRFSWRNPIFPANFGVQTQMFDGAGERKVEVLEAGHFQDEKVVARDLMYLIKDTL